MKEKLLIAVHYLLDRLREPSTLKGIVLIISAGSWAEMDGSSRGEFLMQCGLIFIGLIHIFVPDEIQYGHKK